MPLAPNMRRIYDRPWRNGGSANSGKIPTCVQVAVRPKTTVFAHETMLHPFAQAGAPRTGLARIGGVDVFDRDSGGLGFVFDEGLQLPPGPTMKPRSHAFPRLDPFADMGEVFHDDFTRPYPNRFGDDGFARFVVYVLDAPRLFAGDLPELLFRALAAVGLKTPTQGKIPIALIAQVLAAKNLARADGSEVVFPDIHPYDGAGCHRMRLVHIEDEVEKPAPLAADEFGFFSFSRIHELPLIGTRAQGNLNAPIERIERNRFAFEGISALVEMNACPLEVDLGHGFILLDASEFFLGFVGFAHGENGVAAHLAAQGGERSQLGIGFLMQRHPVPYPMFAHDGHEGITGVGIGRLQRSKRLGLRRRNVQKNRCRALHL